MSYPVYNQQQYMPQMVPAASCGAVSINIMNPTVGYTNPMTQQQYPNGIYQYPQASYYSQQPMQMPYPINYNNNVNNNSLNAVGDDKNQVPTPPAPNATNNEVKNTQEQKEPEKKEETKEKIPLTDDYIKSLENYLNSQDPKIRLMAAEFGSCKVLFKSAVRALSFFLAESSLNLSSTSFAAINLIFGS